MLIQLINEYSKEIIATGIIGTIFFIKVHHHQNSMKVCKSLI
jgi:hypothetical protein